MTLAGNLMDTKLIRLAIDGIQEAVCEIRFESNSVPEIVIGRLTDTAAWAGYVHTRLPTADLPEQLRAAEESFRFAPTYQLNDPSNDTDFVRVGANVISCHTLAPYPGWDAFRPRIAETLSALFDALRNVKLLRIGFRFVNAFSGATHGISSGVDLNIAMSAGGMEVGRDFVLVYSKELSGTHGVQITIATPKYVNGPEGKNIDMLIDIDVSTPKAELVPGMGDALSWIDGAHDGLKEEFFRLIPAGVVDRLRG